MDWYTIQRNNIFAGIPFLGPLTGFLILLFKENNYLRALFLPVFALIILLAGLFQGITEPLSFLDENSPELLKPYNQGELIPYLILICTLGFFVRLKSKSVQVGLTSSTLKRGGAIGVFLYVLAFIFEGIIFFLVLDISGVYVATVRIFVGYFLILKPVVTSLLFIWFGVIGFFNDTPVESEKASYSTSKETAMPKHPALKFLPPAFSVLVSVGIFVWLIYRPQSDSMDMSFYLLFSLICIGLSFFINYYQNASGVVHYKYKQSKVVYYWYLMSREKRDAIKADLRLSSLTIGANCGAIFYLLLLFFMNSKFEFDNYIVGLFAFGIVFVITQVSLSTIAKTSEEEFNERKIGMGITLRPLLYIAPFYSIYILIYAIFE